MAYRVMDFSPMFANLWRRRHLTQCFHKSLVRSQTPYFLPCWIQPSHLPSRLWAVTLSWQRSKNALRLSWWSFANADKHGKISEDLILIPKAQTHSWSLTERVKWLGSTLMRISHVRKYVWSWFWEVTGYFFFYVSWSMFPAWIQKWIFLVSNPRGNSPWSRHNS